MRMPGHGRGPAVMVSDSTPARRHTPPKPPKTTIKFDLARPAHAKLVIIRARLQAEYGRSVTLPEAFDRVLDYYLQHHGGDDEQSQG